MASTISFSGMSSGLDTDSIVEAMVSTYQNRVDDSEKQEILLEWKQDIYKEISSKVYNFYTGTINKLRLESTFNSKLLTSSNTTAIKLDKSSTAPTSTHTLSGLTMATSASMKTYQMPKTTKGESVKSTTSLEELGIKNGDSIAFTDAKGRRTLIQFKDTSSSSGDTKNDAEQGDTQTARRVDVIQVSLSENIGALQSILKTAMPSASVSFDSTAGAFFISSTNTGADQQFEIAGDTDVLQKLGFVKTPDPNQSKTEDTSSDDNTVEEVKNGVTYIEDKNKAIINFSGSDAKYTYNGIEMTSASNNISINGLKFTITSNTADTAEEITVSSSTDVDGMVDTIKSFVEEYNTLISDLNDLINADSAGSYEPLLDDEKEGMTDSQIEKWEKKIKDSLLRNDSTLKSLTSSMRNILSSTLSSNDTYKSLASIGITTSSDWTANGKLELDEDKLKEALTNKPDEVIALFTANGDDETSSTKGLGDRLYESLGNNFKRIANVKSTTSLFSDTLLTNQRTTQSETTDKWEERLETMKEMYYNRFTAMETALSKLNSQTDSLTSLLSS